MSAFNQYLKRLRLKGGIDIGTAAAKTGVHRNTQTKYEDSRDPSIDYLIEFSQLVNEPFIKLITKRVELSTASSEAVSKALESINGKAWTQQMIIKETGSKYSTNSHVIIGEESHKLIPLGATATVDPTDKEINEGCYYAFLNPMSKAYFAAQLRSTKTLLKITFSNPNRDDMSFQLEGGETEIGYILKTLGIVGKIVKTELEL